MSSSNKGSINEGQGVGAGDAEAGLVSARSDNSPNNNQVSSESSSDDIGPVKRLELHVEDLKLFFTMCLAVCYVLSLTVTCSYFTSNTDAFTGSQSEAEIGCYVNPDSNIPTSVKDRDAVNVAEQFQTTIKLGAMIHGLGILGDSSFAIRVWVKKTQWYRLTSLIVVSIYSLLWLGWLVWLHILVFGHGGSVCKGNYLSDSYLDTHVAIPGYAL